MSEATASASVSGGCRRIGSAGSAKELGEGTAIGSSVGSWIRMGSSGALPLSLMSVRARPRGADLAGRLGASWSSES